MNFDLLLVCILSSEDKRVRPHRKTTTEAEGRVREREWERELLLLLGTAGMEVGQCGDGKLLHLVATGMEVCRSGTVQLLLLVADGMEVGRHGGDRVNSASGCLERRSLAV